ncbi:MAG: glycosyltransferase family 2 protein [Myxococcota bacterium]|nr:glycosyltransferase family 2 protein [Myxococcota bacterium]
MLVILPAHNEEQSLPTVLRELLRLPLNMDICVVDSQCSDDTISLIRSYPVQILTAERKGYANALLCGYRYAQTCGAQTIVQLDADGQHPVSYIPHLVRVLSQVDWVVGSRHRTGSGGALMRRAGAFCTKTLLSQTGLCDLSSGFWAFNKTTLSFFLQTFPVAFTEAPLRIQALSKGIRIMEQSLPMSEREQGYSMHRGVASWKHGVSMWLKSRKLKKKYLI